MAVYTGDSNPFQYFIGYLNIFTIPPVSKKKLELPTMKYKYNKAEHNGYKSKDPYSS